MPILAAHNEIMIECAVEQADAASAWLKREMQDGMAPLLRPVPVAVLAATGPGWPRSTRTWS